MSRNHLNQAKRQSYIKSFEQRYKMTRKEFRDLKINDPQRAHELKMKHA